MTAEEALRSGCAAVERPLDVCRLAGPDTPDFLNRLLTLDTKGLAQGARSQAFLLDAKGRIKLAFELQREGPDSYLAYVAPGFGEALAEQLDFYHFGERFTCAPVATSVLTLWGPSAPAVADRLNANAPPSDGPLAEIDVTDVTLERAVEAGAVACPLEVFEARRVALGAPALPHEFTEAYSPLDVSGLRGVTEGKGCYPGQEVVERTLAIGRPAHKRARLALSGPAAPGDLTLDRAPAGRLTSVAQADGGWVGIAVLKQKRAIPGATLDGDGFTAQITEVYELEATR